LFVDRVANGLLLGCESVDPSANGSTSEDSYFEPLEPLKLMDWFEFYDQSISHFHPLDVEF